MVHLERVIARNNDPEMHAASRVPGARGVALRKSIERERQSNRRTPRSSRRRGVHRTKKS